jgi:hypothetical protein
LVCKTFSFPSSKVEPWVSSESQLAEASAPPAYNPNLGSSL